MGIPLDQSAEISRPRAFARENNRTLASVIPTSGALLADQTGMGKTIMVLSFLAWIAENHIFPTGENLPTLVAMPQMLVEEWTTTATRLFPTLKIAIIFSDGTRLSNPDLAGRVLHTSFTKSLLNMTRCPI